jgi:hypothetical protein
MKQELFNCQNGYFGDVARNVLLAKIKIDDALHRLKDACPTPPADTDAPLLSSPECALLTAIKKRLGELNSDIDHLLR